MSVYSYNSYYEQRRYEGYREYERQKFAAGGYVDNLGTLALNALFPVFDAVHTPEYVQPERTMNQAAQTSLADIAILRASREPAPLDEEIFIGRAAA